MQSVRKKYRQHPHPVILLPQLPLQLSFGKISYLCQRSSGRFNGDFAVVGHRRRDLDRFAGHVGPLVQTHLTLDYTGAQAHCSR